MAFGIAATSAVLVVGPGPASAMAGNLIGSANIQNNSIRSIDIRNGTITGRDVKDGSLTAKDFSGALRGATGKTGPRGPAGAAGGELSNGCHLAGALRGHEQPLRHDHLHTQGAGRDPG